MTQAILIKIDFDSDDKLPLKINRNAKCSDKY